MKRNQPLKRTPMKRQATQLKRTQALKRSAMERKPMKKKSGPKRDWSMAWKKIDGEGKCCRVCGKNNMIAKIEAAHIIGREVDKDQLRMDDTMLVLPDRIVPLCGPATDTNTCHGMYDGHRLDLLPYLSIEEQVQAVKDAGGLVHALLRTTSSTGFTLI